MKKMLLVWLFVFVALFANAVVVNVGIGYQYTEIQEALDNFNPTQDEICVHPGVYQPFVIEYGDVNDANIGIYSAAGPYTTIIDGNGSGPCIDILLSDNIYYNNNIVRISGFKVINGYTSEPKGAGINIVYRQVDLYNMIIYNNNTEYTGGGIRASGSDVFLSNCIIFNNSAELMGGGIWNDSNYNRQFVIENGSGIIGQNSASVGSEIYSTCTSITSHIDIFQIQNSNMFGDQYTAYNGNVNITADMYYQTSVEPFIIPLEYNVYNFPNPVGVYTNIMFDNCNNNNTIIKIYNSKGQLIEKLNTFHNFVRINTSKFASGVYFYNVQNDEFNKTNRFIIVK